jgi:hypothetical protein
VTCVKRFQYSHPVLHSELCQWIWSKLLRRTVCEFMDFRNGVRIRRQEEKPGPSGMSRNEAFGNPASWEGIDCLQQVDVEAIRALKEELGGSELLDFVTPDYAAEAEAVYERIGSPHLTNENVWYVFKQMLLLM